MSKKIRIIGPYTPDHEGPFCTRDGKPVELKFRDGRGAYPIGGYIGEESEEITTWSNCGEYNTSLLLRHQNDLMNAREVPVAREFWINEYDGGGLSVYPSKADAEKYVTSVTRTIHVREVLSGAGE